MLTITDSMTMRGSSSGIEFKVGPNGSKWPGDLVTEQTSQHTIKKVLEESKYSCGHEYVIRVDTEEDGHKYCITFVMTQSAWKKNAMQIMYRKDAGPWNNLSRIDFLSNGHNMLENKVLLGGIFYTYLSEMHFIG